MLARPDLVLAPTPGQLPKLLAEHRVGFSFSGENLGDRRFDGPVCIGDGSFVGFGRDFEVNRLVARATDVVGLVGESQGQLEIRLESEMCFDHDSTLGESTPRVDFTLIGSTDNVYEVRNVSFSQLHL